MKFSQFCYSFLAFALTFSPIVICQSGSAFPLIPQSDLTIDGLEVYSRSITVKVSSKNSAGSGVLIQQQGQVYTVLTNAHVLRSSSFQVTTPDGQIYTATRVTPAKFSGYDIALIQFNSSIQYVTARLSQVEQLPVGEAVYTSGFPADSQFADQAGYRFSSGHVSTLLEKAITEGYQLGYTSGIYPGMSGGPVLNQRGEVIGINGLQSAPLWGEPRKYQDGSFPCAAMMKVIENSNWAIPIETIKRLAGQSLSASKTVSLAQSINVVPKVNPQREVPLQILQIQFDAERAKREVPLQILQIQFDAERAKRCL